jgi:hypothetical protein
MHTANFDDALQQFDWNLVNRLNPAAIEATQDSDSLEKLIYSFVDSKFGAVERQFLPFPLSAKFYHLLQLGTDYLLKKIMKLQQNLKKKDEEIQYLAHKLEKTVQVMDALPRIATREVSVVHSCPVCQRAFRALLFLDKHVKKCHPMEHDAWVALRNQIPYGLSRAVRELNEDVTGLRASVTRQEWNQPSDRRDELTKMPGRRRDAVKSPKNADHSASPGSVTGTVSVEPLANRRDFVDIQ